MTIQTLICKPNANEVRFDMVIRTFQIGGYTTLHKKFNKRLMAGAIIGETKREGQRKAKRQTACRNQKKGRELVLLVVRSYLTHGPSNATCMQIVRSNKNGRSKTSINLCNINTLPEKVNAKKTRINDLPIVYCYTTTKCIFQAFSYIHAWVVFWIL
jgi:hypothetical protein